MLGKGWACSSTGGTCSVCVRAAHAVDSQAFRLDSHGSLSRVIVGLLWFLYCSPKNRLLVFVIRHRCHSPVKYYFTLPRATDTLSVQASGCIVWLHSHYDQSGLEQAHMWIKSVGISNRRFGPTVPTCFPDKQHLSCIFFFQQSTLKDMLPPV